MSHKFECHPQYSLQLPAGQAVKIWAISTKLEMNFNVNKHVTRALNTGILLRTTLQFFIKFFTLCHKYTVSKLNMVNPKFVQQIDSEESNSGINTNKTVARLVN